MGANSRDSMPPHTKIARVGSPKRGGGSMYMGLKVQIPTNTTKPLIQ